MKRIDINVDIGEGQPFDADLLGIATSASVCCGAHAGSPEITGTTIELCRSKGVRIGMHPGFPDIANMGRRIPTRYEADLYLESLLDQAKFFVSLAKPAYVKPHGAWYSLVHPGFDDPVDVTVHRGMRAVLSSMVFEYKIPAMLMPSAQAYMVLGKEWVIREGFADRLYSPRGTLMPRAAWGAVLEDERTIREQVLRLAPDVDSLCVHGDTPSCVFIAQLVKRTLIDSGYEVGA